MPNLSWIVDSEGMESKSQHRTNMKVLLRVYALLVSFGYWHRIPSEFNISDMPRTSIIHGGLILTTIIIFSIFFNWLFSNVYLISVRCTKASDYELNVTEEFSFIVFLSLPHHQVVPRPHITWLHQLGKATACLPPITICIREETLWLTTKRLIWSIDLGCGDH